MKKNEKCNECGKIIDYARDQIIYDSIFNDFIHEKCFQEIVGRIYIAEKKMQDNEYN